MSFHFCRKAPDSSIQKYFYSFYFMYSHTSLDVAFTDVPISNQGSTVLIKPAKKWRTHMGVINGTLQKQKEMSSRFPPFFFFFFLLLVLFPTNISEGEEEVEGMLIKICSTRVWRERNYTRGQDYMRLFHLLKTCFEIQHGQKYS